MNTNLKPYPMMKDSGIEWLGEVPKHWEVRRLKYLLRERDKRSADGSEQLLRVSQYTGATEQRSKDGTDEPDTRAASLIGHKCVDPDELVVNIMLAWNGSIGLPAPSFQPRLKGRNQEALPFILVLSNQLKFSIFLVLF